MLQIASMPDSWTPASGTSASFPPDLPPEPSSWHPRVKQSSPIMPYPERVHPHHIPWQQGTNVDDRWAQGTVRIHLFELFIHLLWHLHLHKPYVFYFFCLVVGQWWKFWHFEKYSTRKFIKELVPEVISGMTSQGHCSIICPSTKVARDTPVEVSPGQAGEKPATCLSIVPRNTNAGAGARAHRFNLNSNTSYRSYGSGRKIEISEAVHYRFSEGFVPMDVHWVRMIQTTFQLSVRSF